MAYLSHRGTEPVGMSKARRRARMKLMDGTESQISLQCVGYPFFGFPFIFVPESFQ